MNITKEILINCCRFIQGMALVIYGFYIASKFQDISELISLSEIFEFGDIVIGFVVLFFYVAFGLYVKALKNF